MIAKRSTKVFREDAEVDKQARRRGCSSLGREGKQCKASEEMEKSINNLDTVL